MPRFDETEQNKRIGALYRKEEEDLIAMLAGKYGHQYINLNGITINTDALRLIDESVARVAEIALFEKINRNVRAAIRNPNNEETQKVLKELADRGLTVEIFMTSTASLIHAWERYEDIRRATASQKGVLDISSEEVARLAEIIKTAKDIPDEMDRIGQEKGLRKVSAILEVILGGALALSASDVHLEPEERMVRLRLRIDGVLVEVASIAPDLYQLLHSRLKLLSGLKLNVTDRAQDGRFTVSVGDRPLEIRSSVIPGGYGESIVMRILDPSTIGLSMEQLGINPALFAVIEEELRRPNGMVITTGPTGSGKTTSLYAFLKRIHQPEIKIVTLEDPIEYHLPGIVQTQVGGEYTFATGLRAILRQDPDVIMVGEIRDRDVAETAVHAALTGHLVLSTLHTNSAVGSFPRLIDLGIDPRMIGSSTNLALAQRLARRLCDTCKKEREADVKERQLLELFLANTANAFDPKKPVMVYDSVGCEKCGGSGFHGRIGIYEGIRVDSAVEQAIIEDPREDIILTAAAPQNIPNMQQDGLIKVLAGVTSITELSRIVDLYGEKGIHRPSQDIQHP
ncbi:Flp pilus assembly complex ATPase component TadA [Candidatus Kaiserbacteria bacterium]|nr:Flp pilus assembly complex ATPase component TadA [Candidatus Kaiserbacteria bacterium]